MKNMWRFLNSPIILVFSFCLGITVAAHHIASLRSFRIFVNPPADKMTLRDAARTIGVLDSVSITGTTISRDDLSGFGKVVGTIENRSKTPIAVKQMQVSLIATNGTLLDVSDSYSGGIPFFPGRSQNFSITTGLRVEEIERESPQIKVEVIELELIDE